MITPLRILVLLAVLVTIPQYAAQGVVPADSVLVPVTVTDGEDHHIRLVMGYHDAATRGFDFALGERPIPPVPGAPVLDARFVDPYRQKGDLAGLDSYTDVRPWSGPNRIDTFFVRYRPANDAFPVTFSWPDSLSGMLLEAKLIFVGNEGMRLVNMLHASRAVLESGARDLVIILTRTRGSGPAEGGRQTREGADR